MSIRPDLVACWLFRVVPDKTRLAGVDRATDTVEILLIRRAPDRIYPGLWQCVTGRLEPGERIAEGALREVREETGFGPAELEAFFDTDIVNSFHEAHVDAILVEAVFAAQVRPAAMARLSPEHDDLRWLTPDEARAMVVWAAYRRAIDQVEWLVAHPEMAIHYRLSDPT
jgi:8-oxo-dGTP pyrophosphatase MutT (NUDIX family)